MAPLLATAVRKAARRLVPFLLLLYVLAFLDRVNVGYARQAFLRDTGLGEEAYAFGAGVFFVAYALLEIPSNMVLVRVGARAWIGATMITWGAISAAMMIAWSAPVFYSLRFLLGAAEAGFFPGMIWYLGSWFPARVRGGMFGIFYFGAPLAQIFGGPISGLLLDMNGRGALRGWQWMFLVEGALAVLVGAWTCARLPSSVAKAGWLSAGERGALQAELEAEERMTEGAGKGAAQDPGRGRVWRLGIIYALIQLSFYGVAFYLPSQVSGLLGRNIGFVVGLVSAVPWLCALAAAYAVPRLAARTGRGGATAGAALIAGAVGIALSATPNPVLGLTGLCMAAAGLIGAQPIFWTFPAGAFSGRGAAVRIALINSLGAVGGFLAPNLKVLAEGATGLINAGSTALAGATLLGAMLMMRERPARP
jgi:hypothetical protein